MMTADDMDMPLTNVCLAADRSNNVQYDPFRAKLSALRRRRDNSLLSHFHHHQANRSQVVELLQLLLEEHKDNIPDQHAANFRRAYCKYVRPTRDNEATRLDCFRNDLEGAEEQYRRQIFPSAQHH